LRGYQRSLEDLLLAPEFAHHFIEKISDVFIKKHRHAYQAMNGKAHLSQVTDDYGDQNGLLISPKTFSKFFEQPQRRSIELAKEHGLYVFHHDDGDIRLLLPQLIDMGINLLNPVQWQCGNWDLADLKQRYGDKICFHSAVDNQHTLPFGTPDDVRTEVKWLIETLASDQTGFIIGPCHNFQSNTPVENIIALYDAAREFGTFSTEN
jgi:uroporphyrinogen decarboxylase